MVELIVIAVGLALDQWSKAWVYNNMYQSHVQVIPGVMSYQYLENTGAAYGFMGDKTLLLTIATALLGIVLIFLLIRYRKVFHRLTNISLALMISGAFGNIIDRVLRGFVVDFIKLEFVNFAIFNIADICVTFGTILMLFSVLFIEVKNFETLEKQKKEKEKRANG